MRQGHCQFVTLLRLQKFSSFPRICSDGLSSIVTSVRWVFSHSFFFPCVKLLILAPNKYLLSIRRALGAV